MATKLKVFNAALIEMGHKPVVDTGEGNVQARTLVRVWDEVVEECLSNGSWNFAMETIQATSDTGVTPTFGYQEVFAKPSDWLRTISLSQDEYFAFPELFYYDDSTFWSADYSPIYIRYVSNDTGLGLDLTRWPVLFTRYAVLELCERVVYKLTQSMEMKKEIGELKKKARLHAKNVDAMDEPNPKFPPPSDWQRARSSRNRGDRGSRSKLTG